MLSYTHNPAPDPGAPRLALIHSLALDRSVWDGVVGRLKGETEIITYECRGHGQSPKTKGPYTAKVFARGLAELFDHIGWDKAAVAGCSMGGNVAQAFAAEYPQRVKALGLIDTTACYGADAPQKFGERAEAARVKGLRSMIDFQLTRWFSDDFRRQNPDVVQRTFDLFVGNDLDCYAASCELLGAADTRAALGSFTMPVAIIVGEEDYATPVTMAQQLHDAIPQSTLTIVPRARHLTPIEFPDRIASELRALLSRR
jgi:3-oxoadipate enol-lactonase